jgi:uncharacterized protein YcbK (DUF882 family)
MNRKRSRRLCATPVISLTCGHNVTRRVLICAGAFALLGAAFRCHVVLADAGEAQQPVRSLALRNLHTGETVNAVYWADDKYIPAELHRINYILRDFRTNEIRPIDPLLLDLLFRIRQALGSTAFFDVISGYRSPKTNALLATKSAGVSSHSMHMQGKAADVRLEGCPLETLWRAALAQHAGGVGYYPDSQFVHIDVGPVRRWIFSHANK